MKVTLIDNTESPEYRIGEMSAICYDSDTGMDACLRRAKKCKDTGHLATLRFAYATINVQGISRVCSHQIVRMAHAGILQRSQRYVKESGIVYVDPPALRDCPEFVRNRWCAIQEESARLYQIVIEHKHMKKEDARYILPQGCTTEMNLCLNFQGWRDFLKNRNDKHAQWEVQNVAKEIQNKLKTIAPNIFGD